MPRCLFYITEHRNRVGFKKKERKKTTFLLVRETLHLLYPLITSTLFEPLRSHLLLSKTYSITPTADFFCTFLKHNTPSTTLSMPNPHHPCLTLHLILISNSLHPTSAPSPTHSIPNPNPQCPTLPISSSSPTLSPSHHHPEPSPSPIAVMHNSL